MTKVKTEIMHRHTSCSHIPHLAHWKPLGFGHDDAKLTGGMFYYVGDEEEAKVMVAKRKAAAVKASNSYYSQPWV